jgi:outer membrane protein TolC
VDELRRSATVFADGQAQANNLDIAQAAARLRQADARARQAGAALLPQVGAGANLDTLYGQANGRSVRETDYNAGLDVSYELDFWGRNRDLLNSAKAHCAPARPTAPRWR